MKARRTLTLVVGLALLSAAGIVGMLLVEGAGDRGLFLLAALPLAVGLWRWAVHRGAR